MINCKNENVKIVVIHEKYSWKSVPKTNGAGSGKIFSNVLKFCKNIYLNTAATKLHIRLAYSIGN